MVRPIVIVIIIVIALFAWNRAARELFHAPPPVPMRIYVLSLRDRKDRRDAMRRAMTGLEFSWITAVDGKTLKHHPDKKLTRGEMGCFLSHANAWYEIARSLPEDDAVALVLEDDADVSREKVQAMARAVKDAPDDFDALFVGHNVTWVHGKGVVNPSSAPIHGAQAVLYTRRGATKLLQAAGEMPEKLPCEPVDYWIPKHCKTYILLDSMIAPRNIRDSETQKRR